jgi:deazaflavin-dependent oxidoreductase (nitroreductase family)
MAFDYLDVVERSWPVLRRLMGGHAALYKASGGRIGHHLPGVPPMLLLDHVGARTGQRRTTPLIYGEEDGNLVIVASKGGHTRNPAWFHNLMANPDTTVQVGTERRSVHARMASPEERERLWSMMVSLYPGYKAYQRHTEREIPIVVLGPR